MDTTSFFSIDEIGEHTGKHYAGKFVIKTVLSRRDNFLADERRRFILGMNGQSAMPALQGEALMLGFLSVRIVEAPSWWTESDSGLDLQDENIIGTVYMLSEQQAKEYKTKIQEQAKAALEKMAKAPLKTK